MNLKLESHNYYGNQLSMLPKKKFGKIKSTYFQQNFCKLKNNDAFRIIDDKKPMEYFKIRKFNSQNLRTRNYKKTAKKLFVTLLQNSSSNIWH